MTMKKSSLPLPSGFGHGTAGCQAGRAGISPDGKPPARTPAPSPARACPRFFLPPLLLVLVFLGQLALGPALRAADTLVCASYPVWLFARYLNEGRDYYKVELLTNPATGCPHEFAPTSADLNRLTKTRILVKNGLGLETYLDNALKVAPTDVEVIDASRGLPTLSMLWNRLDFDGTMGPDPGGRQPSQIPNPHVFLSPRLAGLMVANIAGELSRLDPGGAEHYAQRNAAWELETARLEEAVAEFRQTRRGYKIVTSHGFMDYLAQDLGLAVLADISPLGSEAPPSAARLAALGRLVRRERISAVLLDPEADPGPARTLSSEAGIPAAIIDTSTSGPGDPPPDFYQRVVMEDIDLLARMLPPNQAPAPAPGAQGAMLPPGNPRPVPLPGLDGPEE